MTFVGVDVLDLRKETLMHIMCLLHEVACFMNLNTDNANS